MPGYAEFAEADFIHFGFSRGFGALAATTLIVTGPFIGTRHFNYRALVDDGLIYGARNRRPRNSHESRHSLDSTDTIISN